MLALWEHLALADDHVSPPPVGREDHALGKQVLNRIDTRQLVEALGIDDLDRPLLVAIQAPDLLRHTQARGLALDQQLVHLSVLAGLGDLGDEVGQLQPLLPCVDQHNAGHALRVVVQHVADADALVKAARLVGGVLAAPPIRADEVLGANVGHVAREHTPDRAGAEVVLLLDGIGRVDAGHDVVKGRVSLLAPRLPPVGPDDALASGRRLLLELASDRIWSHDLLVAVHDLDRKAGGEEQLAIDLTRIFDTKHRGRRPNGIVAHGQHDVVVAELLVEDDARDVVLVQALHNDDDRRAHGAREAARDRLEECLHLVLAHGLRARAVHAVRVVDDDPIAANTRQARDRGRNPEARGAVHEVELFVLIGGQLDPVAPPLLIPVGRNELAHAAAVARREVLDLVGGADVAQVGHVARPPLPRGPEDVGHEALHRAGRHVDQQSVVGRALADLDAVRDRLEVGGDEVNVPPVNVGLAGLDRVPRLLDEIDEVLLAIRLRDLEELGVHVDALAIELYEAAAHTEGLLKVKLGCARVSWFSHDQISPVS